MDKSGSMRARGGLLARFARKKKDGRELAEKIPFDPEKQIAVLRSSICTGEKVAGFKDLEGGHFTEVMLIRDGKDEQRFRESLDEHREIVHALVTGDLKKADDVNRHHLELARQAILKRMKAGETE